MNVNDILLLCEEISEEKVLSLESNNIFQIIATHFLFDIVQILEILRKRVKKKVLKTMVKFKNNIYTIKD